LLTIHRYFSFLDAYFAKLSPELAWFRV
jgi:hypothetical protein